MPSKPAERSGQAMGFANRGALSDTHSAACPSIHPERRHLTGSIGRPIGRRGRTFVGYDPVDPPIADNPLQPAGTISSETERRE